MFGGNFLRNGESSTTWSQDRTTGLVTCNDISAKTGTLRRGTYMEVEVKARIPRMGTPSSKAVFELMTICTPVPCDSINCHIVIS
jgi:hypothetical protein